MRERTVQLLVLLGALLARACATAVSATPPWGARRQIRRGMTAVTTTPFFLASRGPNMMDDEEELSADDGEREQESTEYAASSPSPWNIGTRGDFLVRESSVFLLVNSVAQSPPFRRLFLGGLATAAAVRYVSNSKPVRRAFYFWMHAGPIIAHYKFTKRWLALRQADRATRDRVYDQLHDRYAGPALDLVLHLRGLYVKLGQILSCRPDFMAPQYVLAFSELQDNIPPWDVDVVRDIALAALREECPAFSDEYDDIILDPEALGSASIGQVHRAVLYRKDNTTKEVAVKVMHQGARFTFENDFQVFRWLSKIALPSWKNLLGALEAQVLTEFDYRNEAEALREVRRNMLQSPYRKRVVVPEPMEELCGEHVLVMEMLHGKKLIDSIRDRLAAAIGGDRAVATKFLNARRHEVVTGEDAGSKELLKEAVHHPLDRVKLLWLLFRTSRIIDLLIDTHGYQIFQTGTWNGDPHFGNCMQLDDGRLGLIDYGQCRRIDDNLRQKFARVVIALDESRITHLYGAPEFNATRVAATMREAGFTLRDNSDNESLLQYARILFDSDEESEKLGYPNPQEYFHKLMAENPMADVPDSAIFVCRTSLMFRGMGHAIGLGQIRTASRWYRHAVMGLKKKKNLPLLENN